MRFCRFRVPLLAEEPRIGISAGERVPLAFATDAKGMCVEFRATFRTIPSGRRLGTPPAPCRHPPCRDLAASAEDAAIQSSGLYAMASTSTRKPAGNALTATHERAGRWSPKAAEYSALNLT